MKMGYTGLSTEVKDICEMLRIKNINEQLESKDSIEDAIFYHNYLEMKLEINKYDKLEDVKNEDFREVPEYMKVWQTIRCSPNCNTPSLWLIYPFAKSSSFFQPPTWRSCNSLNNKIIFK